MSRYRRGRFVIGNKESIIEYLNLNKLESGDHWLWTGTVHHSGYGQAKICHVTYLPHRLAAYVYLDLDINNPQDQALHKPECHTRLCFNPQHLYVGDCWDNARDSSAAIQEKLEFPCGHPRILENTKTTNEGKKICCACRLKIETNYNKLRGTKELKERQKEKLMLKVEQEMIAEIIETRGH